MSQKKKFLNFWVGARMQWTDNLDVEDKLCNDSEGTVKYIHIRTTTGSAKDGVTGYVQYGNEKSGNKKKSNSLPEDLQSCVLILVELGKISYSLHGKNKKSNLILCECKQFPIVLAHALVKAGKFSYSLHGKNKSNLILCERKQFSVVIAHATTIYKTQGSTIDHMTGDLDTTTRSGKPPCPIS